MAIEEHIIDVRLFAYIVDKMIVDVKMIDDLNALPHIRTIFCGLSWQCE